MKAIAIKTSPHFEGMFGVDTVVEMINVPHEKDTLLVYGEIGYKIDGEIEARFYWDGKSKFPNLKKSNNIKLNFTKEQIDSGEWVIINEPTIAPKGSFKDLHFKLPDGRIYDTKVIYNATGKHFSDFFNKL